MALLFAEARPNELIRDDGGLSIFDNPTVNEPEKRALPKIWRKARKRL